SVSATISPFVSAALMPEGVTAHVSGPEPDVPDARGGRVGRLPGDRQGTGRVPHGVGPANGGAGGRAPPPPAGTADRPYRCGRGGCASAGPRPRWAAGTVLDYSISGVLADSSSRLLLA